MCFFEYVCRTEKLVNKFGPNITSISFTNWCLEGKLLWLRLMKAIPNIKTHGQTYFVLLYTTNGFFISCCYTYFLDSSSPCNVTRVDISILLAISRDCHSFPHHFNSQILLDLPNLTFAKTTGFQILVCGFVDGTKNHHKSSQNNIFQFF